jgi:hypothetical protein
MMRGQVIAFVLLGLFLISVLPLFPSALEPIHNNDSNTVDVITEEQMLALKSLPPSVKVSGRTGDSTYPWGWMVNAPNARCNGLVIDSSGNAYITGSFNDTAAFGDTSLTPTGDVDVFVAKLNTSGSWQWAVQAQGSGSVGANGIAVDSNSNVYITGSFKDSVYFGSTTLASESAAIFVAKLSGSGSWQWAVQSQDQLWGPSGDDSGIRIAVDSNSNPYVTGTFRETTTFGSTTLTSIGLLDIFIAKLSSSGSWLWAVKAGGPNNDEGLGIEVDSNGNPYVSGYFKETATFGSTTLTSEGDNELFIAKLSSSGSWLWVNNASSNVITSYSLAVDSSGNAYIIGVFYGTSTFGSTSLNGSGGWDIFIAKFSNSGSWLWAVEAGGSADDQGYRIAVDTSGNAYATGFFSETATFGSTSLTSNGAKDVFIAKLSSSGSWKWAVKLGDSSDQAGMGIAVDSSGNTYVSHGNIYSTFITIHKDQDMDGILNSIDSCPNGEINWNSGASTDHDTDGCRDIDEDDDDDNDGIADVSDSCQKGTVGWNSNLSTDYDTDGCRDVDKDDDDDNDGIIDLNDDCKKGVLGWISSSSTDYDSDGCQDSSEDSDDDNDGVVDNSDNCPTGLLGWISDQNLDYDSDGCRDSSEDLDDDNDDVLDNLDSCRIGALNWSSGSVTDIDGDGCRDLDEDDDFKNQESNSTLDNQESNSTLDNQESNDSLSTSEDLSFVDRLIEGDLDAIGIFLALFLPIIGLSISVMLKKRKIGLVNSITLKVHSADSTEALIQIGLEIDEIMANDKISQVQYQSLKNKIESKQVEFSPAITGNVASAYSVKSSYNSKIGEQSVTMQDNVIGGDSLVGSTKIEKQVYNDPEAIAKAAVEAFRMGAESKNPLSDELAAHFKDDNGNE